MIVSMAPGGVAGSAGRSGATGATDMELGALYAQLGRQLHALVRAGVRASEPVVEDACQVAWGRLIDHQDRVRPEKVLGWLKNGAQPTESVASLLRRTGVLARFEQTKSAAATTSTETE